MDKLQISGAVSTIICLGYVELHADYGRKNQSEALEQGNDLSLLCVLGCIENV